ncbi:hypothetical protein BASA83_004851 [Batrachochytrium salamandrivorans]|nr:hypothetical protein BASA83_004851 [Batrachochytrium salamandrivorans]
MSGNSSRSAAVTPLYNSDGIVQYDPTSILRVMQGHYGSLAADTQVTSLDLQYWHDRQPIQVSLNTPTIRNSDILDPDFSWNQIAAALLQMSPRKAPGDDGITTAFYQAALYTPANTQEGVPPTPFARCFVESMWSSIRFSNNPRAWLCASIISIDKKDGDPLNPGDKRGIALINVGLKLVCKAGFRKREECWTSSPLVDIIQRRQNAGLNTHVLFIDIRKAFDTVPVGALVWKLQNMGFPRRTLAFLKALYTSSSARARAGSCYQTISSTERCQTGMSIVWTSVQSVHQRHSRWCRTHHSPWTIARHEPHPRTHLQLTGHLAPRLDNPLNIRLHGQLVSRVESYKYLGVLIDSKLDHSAWLKQKRSALEHTISALHPVLANHQLTVNYRSRIFSAVVMGKAYYRLELVGGNKSHLAPLQTTITRVSDCSLVARLSTAIGPFWLKLGLGHFSLAHWYHGAVGKIPALVLVSSDQQLYRNIYWLTPQVKPKTVKQRHSFALMETLRTCGDSASLQKLSLDNSCDTSRFFKDPSFDQSRAHGTRYLMLARMDALWTARKAIQIGILVDTHPFSADHCIICDQHYSAHPLPISWWSVNK